MILLTKSDEKLLRLNSKQVNKATICPVVKFFTPDGNATWLISELAEDGDTLFGLRDLGLGMPEIGYVSLSEIKALRGRFRLPVERDRSFSADKTLAEYADAARAQGYIRA
jgi:hypothetical protein